MYWSVFEPLGWNYDDRLSKLFVSRMKAVQFINQELELLLLDLKQLASHNLAR